MNFQYWLKNLYVIFAFCSALFLGALKALIVGPVAGLTLIAGNVGVILGLLPSHVAWTVYTVVKTNRFDAPLKAAILLGLPGLFGLWLSLSIAGTILLGFGYGFFTPWVSTFEAFRHEDESKKFYHCIVDGTWGTVKGSCVVVRDFADMCYHSYPLYLKELRESPDSNELKTLRFLHVPGLIIVGLLGLIVDIPFFTIIAVVKSPYMLFKGWFRLISDLISREGPFLETACIPIAGLTILMWPLVVAGSILAAVFASFFIGLYGSFVVYQERSFMRGLAYVIAMVAEFDEYTNDWLYLREGTMFPKPRYRKNIVSESSELPVTQNREAGKKSNLSANDHAPAMLVPSVAPSRSVRETIQEVKMVQIWGHIMKSSEISGKELLDSEILTPVDLYNWLKAKNDDEATVIGVGLPCYSLLKNLLSSIKSGSNGLLLSDNIEVTNLNRPKDKLMDLFFNPILVLKEQVRVIKLGEDEERFLEKVVLFGSDKQRMDAWENGGSLPEDALRAAQIKGISRRMLGMVRSLSMLPTYRRRYRQVVKALVTHAIEKGDSSLPNSLRMVACIEEV